MKVLGRYRPGQQNPDLAILEAECIKCKQVQIVCCSGDVNMKTEVVEDPICI